MRRETQISYKFIHQKMWSKFWRFIVLIHAFKTFWFFFLNIYYDYILTVFILQIRRKLEKCLKRNGKRNKVQQSESFLTEKIVSTDGILNDDTENVFLYRWSYLLVSSNYSMLWIFVNSVDSEFCFVERQTFGKWTRTNKIQLINEENKEDTPVG